MSPKILPHLHLIEQEKVVLVKGDELRIQGILHQYHGGWVVKGELFTTQSISGLTILAGSTPQIHLRSV